MAFFVRIGILLSLFGLTVGAGHAATVQPMRFELSPTGVNSRAKVQVTNDSTVPITVEATSWLSAVTPDGSETLSAADDDIIVFPPSAIVGPGKKQFFQVQYIGNPELSSSRLYRMRIEQLPVKQADGKIALAFQFNTMLNVVPAGATALPEVSSIERATTPGSYTIEFRNRGNRFVRLHDTTWTISTPDGNIEWSNAEVRGLIRDALVLPQSTRILSVTPPQDLELENASITIYTK